MANYRIKLTNVFKVCGTVRDASKKSDCLYFSNDNDTVQFGNNSEKYSNTNLN